jgi:hypothetical protein
MLSLLVPALLRGNAYFTCQTLKLLTIYCGEVINIQLILSDKHRAFGESLFFEWPKKSNQKKGHPACWFLLRKNPLPPARFWRSSRRAIHGPPLLNWASRPIAPKNHTSIRPKEGFCPSVESLSLINSAPAFNPINT